MDIIITVLLSLLSLFIMFIIIKAIGHRSIAQMTAFDYINGITIGSIAAEMATNIEQDPVKPLCALAVYGITIILINFLSLKSIKLRGFFNGKPTVVFDNQKIYRDALKKVKLDVDEFLMLVRSKGFFDLSEIQTVIFEANGNMSVLPMSGFRPLEPNDIKIVTTQETIFTVVISDGRIMEKNLKSTGNDINWLNNKLKENKISKIEDVFLAMCDKNNNINIYKREN